MLFSLLAPLALAASALLPTPPSADVDAAVRRALTARLGPDAEIVIDEIRVLTRPAAPIVEARLAPNARLGRTLQLRLATAGTGGNPAWTDRAEVRARISLPHAHATRPLARGEQIGAGDVEAVTHEIVQGPLTHWPQAADLVNGRVRRNVQSGICLGRTSVSPALAVQQGQTVTAIARVGGVEATATVVAAASGAPGAIIRVVNQQSRRVLKARIVSAGLVEIVP